MDIMQIRRGLLAQMANGAEIIKGSFTASIQTGNKYTIEFGKSIEKYMIFCEMTEESKSNLLNSGQTSAKMFAFIGIHPMPEIDEDSANNSIMSNRVVPSTSEVNVSSSTTGNADDSSMTLTCGNIGNGANVLYAGYSYNFTIISIK